MYPSVHLVTSMILAGVLYPTYGLMSVLVLISGFLIDVDHWMWYVYKERSLSLRGSYWWYVDKKYKPPVLNVFHTVEVWVIVFGLSLVWTSAFVFALGMFMHIFLDYIHMWWHGTGQERPNFLLPWLFGVR